MMMMIMMRIMVMMMLRMSAAAAAVAAAALADATTTTTTTDCARTMIAARTGGDRYNSGRFLFSTPDTAREAFNCYQA